MQCAEVLPAHLPGAVDFASAAPVGVGSGSFKAASIPVGHSKMQCVRLGLPSSNHAALLDNVLRCRGTVSGAVKDFL